jgi:hypothetical protein
VYINTAPSNVCPASSRNLISATRTVSGLALTMRLAPSVRCWASRSLARRRFAASRLEGRGGSDAAPAAIDARDLLLPARAKAVRGRAGFRGAHSPP